MNSKIIRRGLIVLGALVALAMVALGPQLVSQQRLYAASR